jgi:hypothetical protein
VPVMGSGALIDRGVVRHHDRMPVMVAAPIMNTF